MALQDQKITSSDLANKGVVGLPDTPNLSTLVMQQKFDEIATAVIVPKFNALIDYLIESLAPIVSDNPQDGEVLIYFADSSQYKNGVYRTTLADLKDVNVGGVQNKMFLCYDEDRDLWYPEASSGVMETISACKDVSIVNPQTGDIFKFDGTAWANVPDERGLLIVFNIDSEDGATITALTPSGNTVTATYLGDGNYIIKSDEYGEWHLTGEKNGETVETTVDVSVSQIYDVTMNFFAATITVTYPADATVTCSKDSEEYTATGSPYTFTVHGSGDWVIEGTRSGITETQTVTITTNGQGESVTLTILPDGSTITPTDSIPTLLHCADIWDKSYTSIGEVLDDSDSLFKILTTDNSIDYLVRSTTYASSVTADEDAMSMIGSYDYASDTLIGDSTWATAIMGSTYKDSVINVSVPKMTSNTTPFGECVYTSQDQQAYKAFDEDTSTFWSATANVATNSAVGYDFKRNVTIFGLYLKPLYSGSTSRVKNFKVQHSSDNSTWNDISNSSNTFPNTNTNGTYLFTATKDDMFRVFVMDNYGTTIAITEADFLGRENGGVQNWLRAGGITDKTYTTLAEVLADTTTLSALISNHNAVDYLVTAKGLIDGIVADATAMSYIGLNNYCANTLLSDSVWLNAIANSAYRESVLNVKIPTMTSNTAPSGVASANTTQSGYEAYKCMNGTGEGTNGQGYMGSGVPGWVQYEFTNPIKPYVFKVRPFCNTNSVCRTTAFKMQGSSNDTFTDISEAQTFANGSASSNLKTFYATDNTSISKVRLSITASQDTSVGCNMLQVYGRQDV